MLWFLAFFLKKIYLCYILTFCDSYKQCKYVWFKNVRLVLSVHQKDWSWSWNSDILADSFEKTLMLGKTEHRRKGWQRVRWLDGITDSMDMNLGRLWELVLDREALGAAAHGVTKSQTRQSDWTELNWCWIMSLDPIPMWCFPPQIAWQAHSMIGRMLHIQLSHMAHYSLCYNFLSQTENILGKVA